MMRSLSSVAASFGFLLLLEASSPAQQLARFVNDETGQDVPGNGLTGAAPWKSITYALTQVVLTPTQNLILNIAGRINGSGADILYDEVNGEVFPINLPARVMLTYDTANSEFYGGGSRVPVRIHKTSHRTLGEVIHIDALAGTTLNNQTGLDGVVVGQRLMRVENGSQSLLVRAVGIGAVNDSRLTEVLVSDGFFNDLCFESQGGVLRPKLTGVTATTTLAFNASRTLVKFASANLLAGGAASSELTATLESVTATVAQTGGVAIAHAAQGIAGESLAETGTAKLILTASNATVSGFSNADPANPLGIDTGVWLRANDSGALASVVATLSGSGVSGCGLTGVRAMAPGQDDPLTVTVTNCRATACGARANSSNLLEGHGVSFECAFGGQLTARVENSFVTSNALDGVFTWLHNFGAGASAMLTVQSNEIGPNGRNGVKVLAQNGATLASGSTIFSNRIHHNDRGIHNVAEQSGCTSSPSIVNNMIYRNTTNGILNEAVLAGSVAGPTMTHNTVVETGGVGVLVQGAGTTSGASFHNGISYHVGSPGPADLSGFANNQINYSNYAACSGPCTGTQNLVGTAPQFMNYLQDDYHLLNNPATNLVVDAATNTPPAVPQFDFEGNLRQIDLGNPGPMNQYADMGADEATP